MNKPKYRVLVADDEFFNREIICAVVEEIGCMADRVSNGKEVLNSVKNNCYDLILMDCRMPEMDGYETTKELRAMGNTIPVIGLTSSPLGEDKNTGLDAGMNDFIVKPLTTEQLEGFIERYPAS